jgi:PTS system nitrogen regulatory IIA component
MTGPPSSPAVIRARVRADSVDDALRHIADLLALEAGGQLSAHDVLKGLIQREAVASTNIGSGVAMPHFIDNKVSAASVVAITLESPIKWGSIIAPVDIVFGLSGTPAEPWRHVRSLAHLARLALVPGVADRIRGAVDDEALRRVFAEEDGRHG